MISPDRKKPNKQRVAAVWRWENVRFRKAVIIEEKIVEVLGKRYRIGIDSGIGDVAIACHILRELQYLTTTV